jgi:hypothetical protein
MFLDGTFLRLLLDETANFDNLVVGQPEIPNVETLHEAWSRFEGIIKCAQIAPDQLDGATAGEQEMQEKEQAAANALTDMPQQQQAGGRFKGRQVTIKKSSDDEKVRVRANRLPRRLVHSPAQFNLDRHDPRRRSRTEVRGDRRSDAGVGPTAATRR